MDRGKTGPNANLKAGMQVKPISYIFKEKIWITPALYSFGALLLSLAAFYFDLVFIERFIGFIPSVFLTDVDAGQTILGILAAAMLTMTTFTFSTVLVVLTMYSSQFSPRAPENFIRSSTTRHVLGIFIGGFIFNMLSLLYMQKDVFDHQILSTAIGIAVVFVCIGAFAYYIHFVASNVQVSTLINKLMEDAEDIIGNYNKLYEKEHVTLEEWKPEGEKEQIKAVASGYIQFIDLPKLEEWAERHKVQIEIIAKVGEYVFEGKPLMNFHFKERQVHPEKIFITIGDERTAEEDLEYSIQKIVEVAIRATSPGRQDPNTAGDILLRLGYLLGQVGHLKTDGLVLTDGAGNNRVLYRFPAFSDILYKTFYQISYHTKQDISVFSAMTDALIVTASLAPELRHDTIWKTELYILEALQDVDIKSLDRDYLQQKVDELADITQKETVKVGT